MKLSSSIDLSVLEFLQWGDMTVIADEINTERQKQGITKKVYPSYVSAVCALKHKNHEILTRALKKGLERMSRYPKQVLKVA